MKYFMTNFFIVVLFLNVGCSAQNKSTISDEYAKTIVRFGNKFYIIHVDSIGTAFVTKGEGQYFTEPLQVSAKSTDTSKKFKVPIKPFFDGLKLMAKSPSIATITTRDAQHIEVFFKKVKIYDEFAAKGIFWESHKVLLNVLPKGYNPFVKEAFSLDK